MDVVNSAMKGRGRKGIKVNEHILAPVLHIDEEQQEDPLSTTLDTTIDNMDEDEVQYEFKEGVGSCYIMPSDCVETISCSTNNSQASSTSSESAPQQIQTIYPLNGGICLIASGTKVLNPITPIMGTTQKVALTTVTPSVCRRDEKRRATHNEVERRRRDKINNWILKLSKIIPECKQDSAKGNFESQSKGGILAKACDYIVELRETNERLVVFAKENEQLLAEVEALSQEVERLKDENHQLRLQAGSSHQPV